MKDVVTVQARDGFELSATRFNAPAATDKFVLINPATGVKQSFYTDFATWLAREGYGVYTFDYRGIGQSRPADMKDILCDMHDWSKDVDAMITHIMHTHPGVQLAIVGHSVGGQLLGMSTFARKADALVMVASQTPYWKNYSGSWLRFKLRLFWYVTIPLFTWLYGYFPASRLGLFEDLPEHVALQWSRWARSRNYIFDELPSARYGFDSLNQPALMLSFADDDLAPRRAVEDLKRHYSRLKVDHRHLQPEDVLQQEIGHFGFFKKRSAAILWKETATWLAKALETRKQRAA